MALFEREPGATLDEVAAEAARGPLPETPPEAPGTPEAARRSAARRQSGFACAPEQCTCGNCGAETVVIGYEESERLDVEPPKFFAIGTQREKRACANCKQGGVAAAAAPVEIVEKGLAGSRVIINRVVAKYCNHWSGTPESRSTDALLFD